jgi:hypothetical protein
VDYKETVRAVLPSGYPAIGLSYAKALSSDQVAFGLSDIILPMEILCYAKRNIQEVSSEAQAISWLRHFKRSKGKLLRIKQDGSIAWVKELKAD